MAESDNNASRRRIGEYLEDFLYVMKHVSDEWIGAPPDARDLGRLSMEIVQNADYRAAMPGDVSSSGIEK